MKALPIPNFDNDFARLVVAFEAIAKIPSRFRQQYTLAVIAPYYALPRAEIKRLYQLWLLESGETVKVQEVGS